jgi:GTP1/Obg family GTP-binding protein
MVAVRGDVFNFPFYSQFVPVHSANVVMSCIKACRRVLTSTLLYFIDSESSCDLGIETQYKLYLKTKFTITTITY